MLDYHQIECQANELQRSFLDRAAKRHLADEFVANRPALAQRFCYWSTQISTLFRRTPPDVVADSAPLQVVIRPDAPYWVAAGYRQLWVVSGYAWLTEGGQDTLLVNGQRIALAPDRNGTLVSALRSQKLVLELC